MSRNGSHLPAHSQQVGFFPLHFAAQGTAELVVSIEPAPDHGFLLLLLPTTGAADLLHVLSFLNIASA
jgi:hypothetical protein